MKAGASLKPVKNSPKVLPEQRMNYHLHRQGRSEGTFSLEELRRRRATGDLTGTELVWRTGMPTWQPLDAVLRQPPEFPPGPPPAPRPKSNTAAKCIVIGAIAVFVAGAVGVGLMVKKMHSAFQEALSGAGGMAGVAVAGKPVVWTTNTLTAAHVRRRGRAFRERQWVGGYAQHGEHNAACDAAVREFLAAWLELNFGDPPATNTHVVQDLADRLAADPACRDPLALAVTGVNPLEGHEARRRLERAWAGFPASRHRAYPKWYTAVMLARHLDDSPNRRTRLDAAAVDLFRSQFQDGSLQPEDQPELADILLDGWGKEFFERNGTVVQQMTAEAGKTFEWLALVLEGENHTDAAWKLRGSGWANNVTAEGWKGFNRELAAARACLTRAWELRPDWPQAPALMVRVATGDAGAAEMRRWFDRATTAQLDHAPAWKSMRWGLRPRWHGSHAAMLALGRAAVATGRFDTDVPWRFYDVVRDLEAESELIPGEHLYGRDDLWPEFQKMYEGYIHEPSRAAARDGWRGSYAVLAHLAGRHNTARAQLEALHWRPLPHNLDRWGVELSLLPLEVAALTGARSNEVNQAEGHFRDGELDAADRAYEPLSGDPNVDDRTRAFARHRRATIALEQRFQRGQWINVLPAATHDPAWFVARGDAERLAAGALEVRSGAEGHLLFPRARVGREFEIKGEFEVRQSSSGDFQAGLVLGLPQLTSADWWSFRLKRNADEGDIASLGQGWARPQWFKPVKLNDGPNTFHFRLANGRVSASVNGQPVLDNVAPPRNVRVADEEFRVGLGAFNDRNETVIHYRKLEVRRLQAASGGVR